MQLGHFFKKWATPPRLHVACGVRWVTVGFSSKTVWGARSVARCSAWWRGRMEFWEPAGSSEPNRQPDPTRDDRTLERLDISALGSAGWPDTVCSWYSRCWRSTWSAGQALALRVLLRTAAPRSLWACWILQECSESVVEGDMERGPSWLPLAGACSRWEQPAAGSLGPARGRIVRKAGSSSGWNKTQVRLWCGFSWSASSAEGSCRCRTCPPRRDQGTSSCLCLGSQAPSGSWRSSRWGTGCAWWSSATPGTCPCSTGTCCWWSRRFRSASASSSGSGGSPWWWGRCRSKGASPSCSQPSWTPVRLRRNCSRSHPRSLVRMSQTRRRIPLRSRGP